MNTNHSLQDDNSANNEEQQQQQLHQQNAQSQQHQHQQQQQQPTFPGLSVPTSQYNLMTLPPSLPNVTNTFNQNRSSSSATSGGSASSFTNPFNPSYLSATSGTAQVASMENPHYLDIDRRKSSEDSSASYVQLARRRRSSKSKDKQQQRKTSAVTRPQGRPLSKETRVRLTLVPTLGILYSILVSDTMRKTLKVLQYSNEDNSIYLTNEELSTRNVISGFSSLLNVKVARFSEDGSYSPEKNANIPKFVDIDEAVRQLFGLTDYTLIRVSRAAATEIGGSVLLKIETAMPGYSHLNDDEDEDLKTVEENKMYSEAIGSKGDRPSTIFLKKKVARPRYKSDMRIYLIPRINSCAIYCEKRMFKRDLLRGFLNLDKLDRSIIVAFNYEEAIDELKQEGHEYLIKDMSLPTAEEFNSSSHLPESSGIHLAANELSISKQSELQHLQQMQSHQHHTQMHNHPFQFGNEYGQHPPPPLPQAPLAQMMPHQHQQQQLGMQNPESFMPGYYQRQLYDQGQSQPSQPQSQPPQPPQPPQAQIPQSQQPPQPPQLQGQPQHQPHANYNVPQVPPGPVFQPFQQSSQTSTPQPFPAHQMMVPPQQGQHQQLPGSAQPAPQPEGQTHQNIPFQGFNNYPYPQDVPTSNQPSHLEGGYLPNDPSGVNQQPLEGRTNLPFQQPQLPIYNNQQQMYPPPNMGQYYPPQQQDPNNNQYFQ